MGVQIIGPSPAAMQRAQLGEAIGGGLAKKLGLMEAEKSFQQAEGDPFKLATAMGRLLSISPDMARAAGPMYQAMLQQAQGRAAGKLKDQAGFPTQLLSPGQQEEDAGVPSLAKGDDFRQMVEGYRPPSQQQIFREAAELFNENPALFEGKWQNAVDFVQKNYETEKNQIEASTAIYEKADATQKGVLEDLKQHAQDLSVKIPNNTYAQIEKKAIEQMKKGKPGEQVKRELGEQLDEISRQYSNLEQVSKSSFLFNPKQGPATLRSLQKDFEKRGKAELRNFADILVTNSKVSYPTAYALSDPISNHPNMQRYIEKLPVYTGTDVENATEKIVPKLANLTKKTGASPLAVMYWMREKGYDPLKYKSYLDANRDDLNLDSFQLDQLAKEVNPTIRPLPDIWLTLFGGIK